MAIYRPDQTLDEMIASLGELSASDREDILDQLDDGTRLRVSRLLAGRFDKETTLDPEALISPWLAERITSGHGMTHRAHDTLISCAGHRATAPLIPSRNAKAGPSLFARLTSTFRGAGEAS